VELLGVVAGQQGQADDGVFIHAHQAAGLSDADPLGDVLQDGHRLALWQARVEEGCPFAFGEACLAGLATEQAALLRALAHGNGQVAEATLAIVGAGRILATEGTQVVGCGAVLAHG
jgi:hypothetical protein